MKNSILFIFLFSLSFIFSQEELNDEDLHQIPTKWKLGEERLVSIVEISYIYFDDTLFSESKTSEDYLLRVIDTTNRTTLLLHHKNKFKEEEIEHTDHNEMLKSFLTSVEKRMTGLPYELLIDRSTGLAFEVKNTEVYEENLSKVTDEVIDDYKQYMSQEADTTFKENVMTYLKNSKSNVFDLVIGIANEILEPYSYVFPLNSSLTKKVVIDNISVVETASKQEVPAELFISSEENEETISVNTNLTYDKEAYLKLVKQYNAAFINVKSEDISIIERKSFEVNKNTNWLTTYSSEMLTQVPGAKIVQISTFYFNEE